MRDRTSATHARLAARVRASDGAAVKSAVRPSIWGSPGMLPLSLSARRFLVLAVVAALFASVVPGMAAPRVQAVQAPGDIFISEFHYDNAAADEGEFVEVTAPAGTDLTGWSIVLYNGDGRSQLRHRFPHRHRGRTSRLASARWWSTTHRTASRTARRTGSHSWMTAVRWWSSCPTKARVVWASWRRTGLPPAPRAPTSERRTRRHRAAGGVN